MEAIDDAGREQVDRQLSAWRQGGCVIGEHWFLFRTDAERPLTADAAAAATEGSDNAVESDPLDLDHLSTRQR